MAKFQVMGGGRQDSLCWHQHLKANMQDLQNPKQQDVFLQICAHKNIQPSPQGSQSLGKDNSILEEEKTKNPP